MKSKDCDRPQKSQLDSQKGFKSGFEAGGSAIPRKLIMLGRHAKLSWRPLLSNLSPKSRAFQRCGPRRPNRFATFLCLFCRSFARFLWSNRNRHEPVGGAQTGIVQMNLYFKSRQRNRYSPNKPWAIRPPDAMSPTTTDCRRAPSQSKAVAATARFDDAIRAVRIRKSRRLPRRSIRSSTSTRIRLRSPTIPKRRVAAHCRARRLNRTLRGVGKAREKRD